jgi:CHAD domain-containing protein
MLAQGRKQMTAQRTSIGRRLAIGRRAHRPPIRLGKTGHRLIVAPLLATVAASVAVGAVVALARASGPRRAGERRGRRDRLGLRAEEPLGPGLRRMALEQLALALELLGGPTPLEEKAVHETRKAIKRLRALLRLLEGSLSAAAVERESELLREVARSLSPARDAAVMLATLDRLLIDDPALAASGGVVRLRRRLALEHAQAERETFAASGSQQRALALLEGMRERVLAWQLEEANGIELVATGLRGIYGSGRHRYRRLVSGRHTGMRARHKLRKEVKDLRYVAEMLERADGPGRAAGKTGRKRVRDLHRLARRADEIAEALGEEHDLGLLVKLIEAERRAPRAPGARPLGRRRRRALSKLAQRRRRLLRKRALGACKRLYAEKPKRFVRRMDRCYRACEPPGLSSR